MNKEAITENWNAMALAYDRFTSGIDSYSNAIEWPAIKKHLTNVSGKTVLDLGCGSGRYSFRLEEAGAQRIIGLDASSEMLLLADREAKERDSNVVFKLGDIESLQTLPTSSVDMVFSSTTLHYVEQLGLVFSEIQRVLRPDGQFILSVIHPLYSALYPEQGAGDPASEDVEWQVRYLPRTVRSYVQPWIEFDPKVENFLSSSYHHTMGDYVNGILSSGLTLTALEEPEPPAHWEKDAPNRFTACLNTPTFAVFVGRKPSTRVTNGV